MRERLPSQTAAMVAMLRALADRGFTHVPGFSDPVARRLLPELWLRGLSYLERGLERMQPAARDRIETQIDIVTQRVRAIDIALEEALTAGIGQVVILGAGLDTRAFRLPALAGADVFEVDHPASQTFKRRKAAGVSVMARSLRYVPVDFERDSLDAALSTAGYRPTEQTVWIWEGVVMYLTQSALDGTLRTLARLSAPRSKILLHYHEPDSRPRGARWIRWFTRVVGEPQIGLRTRAQLRAAVEAAGFRAERDQSVHAEQASRLLTASL